ncbi:MAG: pepP [Parachlamydiales bacterium]|nr:pepP [Parachlamydiales bacterium]
MKIQERLRDWKIDALLIENPIDLLYLTRLTLSKGRLWVFPDRVELVVDGRYFSAVSGKAPCPVSLWVKGKELPQTGNIGFDSAWTTVANLGQLQKESPDARFIPIVQPLKELRLIKEPNEIEHLRRAAQLTWEGIRHIQSRLKEGISEKELAFEFEFFVRQRGAGGMAFDPIVAFGENSAYPHHRAADARLQKDQIVLVDVGAMIEKYCADATRTFFFGRPDPMLQKMQDLVRAADRAAREQVRVGATVGSLDRAARDVFKRAGVEELFSHSLGHGIGLEAHECPLIRWDGDDREMLLQSGMVIAIEPGLYRPGLGGVRYENTGIVTKEGFESFYPLE